MGSEEEMPPFSSVPLRTFRFSWDELISEAPGTRSRPLSGF